MKISGYTWAANVVGKLLPYEAAIKSLLLIADEAWIAYDPRYDSSDIFTSIDPRVHTVPFQFNPEKITGNGEQLTEARKRCNGDWLFLLDLDEVIHEKDIRQIIDDIKHADVHGYDAVEFSCFNTVAQRYTFREQWSIRPKFTRNIEDVIHGFADDALKYRDDGGPYLVYGDGVDFVKDGKIFNAKTLIARDTNFLDRVQNKEKSALLTVGDVCATLSKYPHIYHYARYSFQRKNRMDTYRHFAYHLGLLDEYDPDGWINALSRPVILEPVCERHNDNVIGPFEILHPAAIQPWVDMIDSALLPVENDDG